MTRRTVTSDAVARPVGPYSSGTWAGDILFLSGILGQDPATGSLVEGGVARQAEQAFANIASILAAAGKGLDDVVRVGVYLVDMADFARMNEVYARQFSPPHPARTTVAVAGLPLGALVEIEVVAR